MSRVYFHSQTATAELMGSERAWASGLVSDLSGALVLPRFSDAADRLLELVPRGHYLHATPRDGASYAQWKQQFETAWRVELDFEWRGHVMDAWTFSLNTALVVGNDAIRFLARMHAQCEIHGYVEGPNRAWLADVMQEGRDLGIYRAGQGWESVIDLLRTRDDEPVVMSYSVTDGFPNAYSSDWLPAWPEGKPERWDALTESEQATRETLQESWYELPASEQWERGLRWLRAQPGLGEIEPGNWSTFRFGHGLSVLDLLAHDRDRRLDAALP